LTTIVCSAPYLPRTTVHDTADRVRDNLAVTSQQVFAQTFDAERARRLDDDVEDAERVEAFVSRFSRLQDTIDQKLTPAWLAAAGEPHLATADALDRAERFGLIPSTDDWLAMRKLRNQVVHEYTEDRAVLANAPEAGHEFAATLRQMATTLSEDIHRRGWVSPSQSN